MNETAVDAVALAGSVAAQDYTLWALFLRADLVVQSVMILLIIASIVCWTIIFDKIRSLKKLNKLSDDFEQSFWSGGSLDDLYDRTGSQPNDPMSALFAAAMKEWRRGNIGRGNLSDRIERVMQITLTREIERTEKHMTFLATTGSTAPFVGLFGTVWGIMNSFQAIAATKNTTLAVVAPGIAEALFATALGLLAAIPAVVAYNKLSKDIDRYASRLDSFAGEFSAILSRQADQGE